MKYNEFVERYAPRLGRNNLVNGLSCPPFVYMEDSDDGMWVHYVTYCENIRKLKRALWLARAERAHDRGMRILRDSGMMFAVGKCHEWDILNSLQKKWQRVADKCRNKAEEYNNALP